MPNKLFAERLNHELSEIGVPESNSERVEAFAKLLKIPKFKAATYLNGQTLPDEEKLSHLADELEVSVDWLIGKSEDKTC